MQDLKQKFNEIKNHVYYNTLMSHAKNLSYKDVAYSKKLVSARNINHFNSGSGYETDVTSASYEDNFSYDLQITKKYYKQIISKKFSLELYYMLLDDLEYYSYSNINTVNPIKYLHSDILFLKSLGLVEIIGNYYLVSNLENDNILAIKFENVLYSSIYDYLFFYKVFLVPAYIILIILAYLFLVVFFESIEHDYVFLDSS